MNERDLAIERIRKNIQESGFHLYQLLPNSTPGFFYTIGLTERIGAEIVLAGCGFYSPEQLVQIVQELAQQFTLDGDFEIKLKSQGVFTFHEVETTWSKKLLAGAIDYYSNEEILAFQVMPEQDKMTLDVPDMTEAYDPEACGGWRWLTEPWPYDVAAESKAVTNVDALLGYPITEVTRWEKDQWEMFSGAGPEVDPADIRVVPLATLIGEDDSLEPVLKLDLEQGIWREDAESDWNAWD
ncbi:DUF4262 domain-containing protein [Roseiconus sp. JC912]